MEVLFSSYSIFFTSSLCMNINSRKSVRCSAVPVAPKLLYVGFEDERGSGPEGANDLCLARIKPQGMNLSMTLGFEPHGWDWRHQAEI